MGFGVTKNTRVPFDYKPRSDRKPLARRRRPHWLAAGVMFPLLGGLVAYTANEERASKPVRGSDPVFAQATDTDTPRLAGLAPDLIDNDTPADDVPARELEQAPATETPVAEPAGEQLVLTVRRNDTLERLFRRHKLDLEDLVALRQLRGVRRSLDRIHPGDKFNVVHDDGAVLALKRRVSETEVLSVVRGDAGFASEIIETPIDVRTAYAVGTIDSSLFVAARAAGINPETILRMANDIFGWDIDFGLDIRPGDRFSVIYEKRYRDGEYLGDGRILAAEFVNAGETYRAVRYASDDGRIDDYFTPEGRSMRRQFLRAPLDFRRVSSNFNLRRRHPILNRIRAHQGVDYAAARGTFVKAAGDGRVSFIGHKGGYGRTLVLEHGGGISTLYAHMARFARGLRRGQRVRQGQTIGYVGSSGAATGPHLHYEYRVNGVHKNPRTVRLPDAAPLPKEYLADFRVRAGTMLALLEEATRTALATAERAD